MKVVMIALAFSVGLWIGTTKPQTGLALVYVCLDKNCDTQAWGLLPYLPSDSPRESIKPIKTKRFFF